MGKRASINFARRLVRELAETGLDRAALVTELKSRGFRQLGRGAFGVVLAHADHPDVVIKVARMRNRRRGLTDGFPKYVAFARNSSSKFVPRIYEHKLSNPDTHLTAMERLYANNGCRAAQRVTSASATALYGGGYSTAKPDGWAMRLVKRLMPLGYVDIHSRNVMRRADGSIVISDPLLA